ncbi:efflux RND transporter permease subunit, partial [Candidatus Saccharibacteria bacterium]|nr:efflux RND transporter permease subunit [Candidatus Saccharibacteria bacterium]
RRGLVAVVISLVFMFATAPVFQQLKFDIFPTSKDSNDVQVELTFAPQTSLGQAQAITKTANQQIKDTLGDDLKSITYVGNANNRQAVAYISLTPYQERNVTSHQIVDDLEGNLELDNTRIVVSQGGVGPPKELFPFNAQIPSDNPEQADTVAQNLVKFLEDKEIKRQNGTSFHIKEVEYTGEQVSITRVNGKRIVEVSAN